MTVRNHGSYIVIESLMNVILIIYSRQFLTRTLILDSRFLSKSYHLDCNIEEMLLNVDRYN